MAPSTINDPIEFVSPSKADLPLLFNLLDRCFDYPDSQNRGHYHEDFAPFFLEENLTNIFIAKKNSVIIAAGCLLPRQLNTPFNGLLSIGLIGAIATDEDYRNQGLAKSILLRLEGRAKELGIVALYLWGQWPGNLYKNLKYRPVGKQIIVNLAPLKDISIPAHKPVTQGNFAQLTEMKDYNSVIRSILSHQQDQFILPHIMDEHIDAMLKIPSINYIQYESAIILFNRGGDLQGAIHSFAGKNEDLLVCLKYAYDNKLANMILIHPNHEVGKIFPKRNPQLSRQGHLCLFKPLNPNAADWEQLHKRIWFSGLDSM